MSKLKRKVKRRDYLDMHPVDVYKLVVTGEIKKFPNGYLNKEKCCTLVRHIILEVYKYDKQKVLRLEHKFFVRNFLGGLRKRFKYGDAELIINAFPEWNIKYWEFNKVPWQFWESKKNRKDFLLWICEKEGLNPAKKEDLRKITAQLINRYGGSRVWKVAGDMYILLCDLSGRRYKKWEIIKLSSWTKEEAVEAVKWFVEKKMKCAPEQACKLTVAEFASANLDGMLQKVFNHSIFQALDAAYPGKYVKERSRFGIRYIG